MRALIKHNLSLLKSIHFSLVFLIIVLTVLYIRRGYGLFIMIIPTIVGMSVFTLEDIDGKNYNTIFSLPTTKAEFAKAKFITYMVIYGASTLFVLVIYGLSVLSGVLKPLDLVPFLLELSMTFPVSIFLGGLVIEFVSSTPAVLYILIMNSFVSSFKNDEFHLGQDIISDVLIVIIWLGLSISACIYTKNTIKNYYNYMEL
ncbi:MAG TPA: hypothetical protein GX396_00720 [Tissierellia bacterium]|nr:hypothetical protein [Tissierellia bacterium]